MKKSYQFGEGPIFTITNYIMWLFAGNIYFFLCNIPLVFMLLVPPENITPEYWTLFVLSLIPVGPAFTALLSVMGKLVREKDVNITKDYFKAYKNNFFQSITLWIIQMVIVGILVVDIRFFSTVSCGLYIKPLFLGFVIIVVSTSFYTFPIISRFYMKNLDIIKLSFVYTILKFKTTILILASVAVSYYVMFKGFALILLFIMSGVCYIIMFYQKDNLKEIEEKMKPAE